MINQSVLIVRLRELGDLLVEALEELEAGRCESTAEAVGGQPARDTASSRPRAAPDQKADEEPHSPARGRRGADLMAADPFVRIPRRFVDAHRMGEVSAGAFQVGLLIACRADFFSGRYIVTLDELLHELDREPSSRGGSRDTLSRQLRELHPDWTDFTVGQGRRRPWVITLTGLAVARDFRTTSANSAPSSRKSLPHGVDEGDDAGAAEPAAASGKEAAATSAQLPQGDSDKREKESNPRTVSEGTNEGVDAEQHVLEEVERLQKRATTPKGIPF